MVTKTLLKTILEEEEGLKLTTYPGPVTGLPHIGIGHLLGQEQDERELRILGLEDELEDWTDFTITTDQAYQLLDYDIDQSIERLPLILDERTLETIGESRRTVLCLMEFQMGVGGIQKFKSFLQALKDGDWDRAADEMLWSNGLRKQRRSAWYQQTPDRCQEMADIIRSGVIQGKGVQEEGTKTDTDLLKTDTDLAQAIQALNTELVKLKDRVQVLETTHNTTASWKPFKP